MLAFAKFVTREIAEAVVGRVFVHFAECWIVENLLDEFVDGEALVQNQHADVNQFGGRFADQADTQEPAIRARKNELEHAGSIPRDMTPGVVRVEGAPDAIFDSLLLAGLLNFTGRGNFRNGVNTNGEKR